MKLLKKYLIIASVAVVYYTTCMILQITCPIKMIIGVPCPTCGMTRAMLALIRMDIKKYIEYNPMAVFVFFAVVLCLHREYVKKKKWIDLYITAVLVVNSIVYIVELIKWL